MHLRRVAAAAAIPLLLASVGCEKDKEKAKKDAGQPCDNLLKGANASAALPSDIPAGITGATFYDVSESGKTKLYFAYLQGTDVPGTRDTIKAAYQQASIDIKGTDQEDGAEAEMEFEKGSTEGTVQVIPYCQGYVRIRYKVGPK